MVVRIFSSFEFESNWDGPLLDRLEFPETWPTYFNYFQVAVGKQCPYNQCIIDLFWPTTNAEFYRKALNPFYIPFKRLESLKKFTRNRGSLPIVPVANHLETSVSIIKYKLVSTNKTIHAKYWTLSIWIYSNKTFESLSCKERRVCL